MIKIKVSYEGDIEYFKDILAFIRGLGYEIKWKKVEHPGKYKRIYLELNK
jgi:hypothetical protein